MKLSDSNLLYAIEALIVKTQDLAIRAERENSEALAAEADYALTCLLRFAEMTLNKDYIFGIEPWHPVQNGVKLPKPGEMLLRLNDSVGEALAPYPAIMTFYKGNMASDIDNALFLSALKQFRDSDEKQMSVNISAASLRSPEFVKSVLSQIEKMRLGPEEKIIVEIHESAPVLSMSKKVLDLFRKCGVAFAIDDVGVSIEDVFRLSQFETIVDFLKVDRQSVIALPEEPHALPQVMAFLSSILPHTSVVAEGVRSTEQAQELAETYPSLQYVQGRFLPGRDAFAAAWGAKKLPPKNS